MKRRISLRFFLLTSLIAGIFSFVWLLLIPGDPKSAWILGLSQIRLVLLAGMILTLIPFARITYKANRDTEWYQQFAHKVDDVLTKKGCLTVGTITTPLGFITGIYLLSTAFTTTDLFIKGYLTRLAPWLFWFTFICGQVFIIIYQRNVESWKQNLRKNREYIFFLGLVFFISLVVFKVTNFSISHWNKLSNAAYGIIIGQPHWRAYSNRLLGPYTVYLISQLGFSFETALEIFNFIMLWVQNTILYSLLLQYTKNSFSVSLRYIIYFSFIFISLQDYYSYTWDYIDAIIFTLFAWGIFREKPTKYFVVLFLVELLNREIALFISFYLIIDAFKFYRDIPKSPAKLKITINDRTKLSIGALLTVAGAIYTKIIRDLLFVESSLNNVGADISHKLIGNHFQLVDNIKNLFFYNFTSLDFINSIFVFGVIAYFLLSFSKFTETHFKAFIVVVIILISIFVFGLVNETRMFIILIPFLLFFHIELGDNSFGKNTATGSLPK